MVLHRAECSTRRHVGGWACTHSYHRSHHHHHWGKKSPYFFVLRSLYFAKSKADTHSCHGEQWLGCSIYLGLLIGASPSGLD